MNQENEPNSTESIVEEPTVEGQAPAQTEAPPTNITKIADLQRMNIDELNHYALEVHRFLIRTFVRTERLRD